MPHPPHNENRRIWHLALPIILANLSTPLLGMVDTAVMGHLPQAHYLAAIALGSMIFSFLFWGFGFLRMGTTGLTAQAAGREDSLQIRAILARSLLLATGLAGLLLLLHPLIGVLLFSWIEAGESALAEAQTYFAIRIWAAPATLVNYVLWGWFLGLHNSRVALAMTLLINGLNVLLDLAFVLGLGMRTEGVALASVLAEYAGMSLGLLLLRRRLRTLPHKPSWKAILCWQEMTALLRINGDLFIRTLLLLSALAFFTLQGARLGDLVLAANAVLMNFQMFMAYVLDGFAHAAEAVVGDALGRRDRHLFLKRLRITLVWSLGGAALFSLTYALGGMHLIHALTDLPEVRAMAGEHLLWVVLLPLLSVWSFWLDGIFIGATWGREQRNAMFLAVGLYLALWYLARPWGNHGLWLALMGLMAARGLGLGAYLAWRLSGNRLFR